MTDINFGDITEGAQEMKSIVRRFITREIISEVMEPEYEQRPSGEDGGLSATFGDRISLTDDQLTAKVSRAIRLCAAASAEIEAAFRGA